MGVGVHQDVRDSPVLDQQGQYFPDIATLGGPGVEFAVTVGAGPAFAKTVVGVRVTDPVPVDFFKVIPPGGDVFAPFQHNGPDVVPDQFQGRKQPGRTRSHDHGGVSAGHGPERHRLIQSRGRASKIDFRRQHHLRGVAPGVQGTPQDPDAGDFIHGTVECSGRSLDLGCPVPGVFRCQPESDGMYHVTSLSCG